MNIWIFTSALHIDACLAQFFEKLFPKMPSTLVAAIVFFIVFEGRLDYRWA